MADKGIIYSAPMILALIDGRKTQTRRLISAAIGTDFHRETQERHYFGFNEPRENGQCGVHLPCLPYAAGDRLYVREAWTVRGCYTDVIEIGFKASENRSYTEYVEQIPVARAVPGKGKWPMSPKYGPSIHMPRWASRITQTVAKIRVQRLQDISEEDAIAEGLEWCAPGKWAVHYTLPIIGDDPRVVYSQLWNTLHTKPGTRWEDDPWVFAATFDVQLANIDILGGAA